MIVAKLDEKNILMWETALQMMIRSLERWPMTSQFAPVDPEVSSQGLPPNAALLSSLPSACTLNHSLYEPGFLNIVCQGSPLLFWSRLELSASPALSEQGNPWSQKCWLPCVLLGFDTIAKYKSSGQSFKFERLKSNFNI